MTYDLIIFDYDGVVADSELLTSAIMAEELTALGLPTTLDEVLTDYVGRRWRDNRALVEARHGRPCPEDFHPNYSRISRARAQAELEPVAGLVDFLHRRTEARCIASSSGPDWLALGLDRFGLAEMFADRVYSAALHVERGKPHPDVFLYAAKIQGVDPARALVIEDSEAGVMAGVSAGMTVVGLTAGSHIREGHAARLRQRGAHHIAESYDDVAAFMDR
ncbi:MAG: HAD-IA family hydrolase [Candidatus Brevundimonas colombiensis]|uniref:HAD-IA family hydrolase n=1 Tax=Candidatus Brevundimonas colombiensis TaxID=3121376 RepID=A0AAJ5WYJ5_9CAUL|nr:HAD-IA family hydrolase [Brevundimonas sp.]WEK39160.1 MAG: HAD-IA family hydrolase [Brevundimonas sp.]